MCFVMQGSAIKDCTYTSQLPCAQYACAYAIRVARVLRMASRRALQSRLMWGERERDLLDINFVGVRKIWLYHEQCDLKMQKKNSDVE